MATAEVGDWVLGKIDRPFRILSLFLFGDLMFACLPVVVLAFLTMLLGEKLDGFLMIKEWSFASIVLFGVSIRKLIRLKIHIQETPRSYKLDIGVQVNVLFVIASVLVLALVILSEKGVFVSKDPLALGTMQFLLFTLAATAVLLAILNEQKALAWPSRMPKSTSRAWHLRRINSVLAKAETLVASVLEAADQIPPCPEQERPPCRRDEEREAESLGIGLARLEKTLRAAKERLRSSGAVDPRAGANPLGTP
jgi:hypothetical protein